MVVARLIAWVLLIGVVLAAVLSDSTTVTMAAIAVAGGILALIYGYLTMSQGRD
jgi:mannose/fructose/N-acetylgalactosamine-specific phosphotransferase system component IIC